MKNEGEKLFEDINLQYMEPLEGEEESEEQDDASYKRYLNNVKKDLNLKQEKIVFIQDLGLSNNILDVNGLFEKIKKKSQFKNRNSYLSVLRPNKEDIDDIKEDDNNKEQPKKIIPIRRKMDFKGIKNLLMTKTELKRNMKNGKRLLTYDNRKKIYNYYKIKHILLTIRERKKIVRKIKSQKIFKKIRNGHNLQSSGEDSFGKKKHNKLKDTLSLLDSSKKTSKNIKRSKKEQEKSSREKKSEEKKSKEKKSEGKKSKEKKSEGKKSKEKKEEKEKDKKEEKKQEIIEKIKNKNDEILKKINDKKIKKENNLPNAQKKKLLNQKNSFIHNNSVFKRKETKPININKYSIISQNKNKFKSQAINSILRDIKDLSQSLLTSKANKSKDKKNKTILYDKHFGYEYWKENELRKYLSHHSTTNRNTKNFKFFYSPKKEQENYSMMSNNFSWLYNKNNADELNDYDTDFTLGFKDRSQIQNPYSINWTKSLIQNSYNRKIKLKNNIPGVPKIELVRVKSSFFNSIKEKVKYDNSKKVSEISRKANNMFGRIYKNNEVKFPVIKNF